MQDTPTWTPLFGEAPDRPAFDRFNPPNWLGALNPFGLQRPPINWLLKLWNRDPELRILPGLSQCVYRVARRTRSQVLHKPILGNDSETGRMCREKLIPVVSLIPTIKWNDDFFMWLDDHDSWLWTNQYTTVADRVEEVERMEEARVQRSMDDDGDVRGRAAWQALKMRTGQKVFVHQPSWSLDGSNIAEPSVARGPQPVESNNGSVTSGCSSGQAEGARGNA